MPARLRWAGGRRPGTRRQDGTGRRGSHPAATPAPASRRCPDRNLPVGTAGRRPEADWPFPTVVEHLDDDPAPVGADPHLGAGTGTGVLEHVGERLLDDAVGRQVHAGREPGWRAIGRQRAPRPARRTCSTSRGASLRPGWGPSPSGSVSGRRTPSRWRSSSRAWRPASSTAPIACRAASGSSAATALAAPACTVITLTRWATTSCSSRAMRVRSSVTIRRASAACSCCSWAARSERSRRRRPTYQGHEHGDAGEDGLPPRGRVGEAVDDDHDDGRVDAQVGPPVGGGVPPGAVQGDERHPAEVGVAAPDGHGPGGHDHAHHGQGRPPTPVQRRAGHGEHQQDGDRDVAEGADDQRIAGPVGHEHRPQEDRGRQGRRPRPGASG